MATSENHHAFSFIVDGISLSDEQKARIAGAVARAGTEALANLNLGQEYITLPLLPKWRGIPAVALALDHRLQEAANNLIEKQKTFAAGL